MVHGKSPWYPSTLARVRLVCNGLGACPHLSPVTETFVFRFLLHCEPSTLNSSLLVPEHPRHTCLIKPRLCPNYDVLTT